MSMSQLGFSPPWQSPKFQRAELPSTVYELEYAPNDSSLEDDSFLGRPRSKILLTRRPRPRSRVSTIGAYVVLYTLFNVIYGIALVPASTPAQMNGMLGTLGALIFASVAFYSALFWLALYRRVLVVTCCSLQVATLLFWYLFDNGNTLDSHGSYNLLIFFLILTPGNIVIATLCIWYRTATGSGQNKKPRRFWKQLICFIIFGSVVLFVRVKFQQGNLKYGFFGREIPCSREERISGTCSSCQWEETIPWFDLLPVRQNFFTGPMTCPKDQSFSADFDEYGLVVKGCQDRFTEVHSYFNKSVIHHSHGPMYSLLPRTETWGLASKNDTLNRPFNGFQDSVLRYVEDNTFPYSEDVTIGEEYDSVLVHCGSAPPTLAYRVQPTTQSAATKKPHDLPRDSLNVVVLFIDAMSRNHFHRRLPQTRHALETLTKCSTSPIALYELFRYHSVGINTTPNTRALWAGLDEHNTAAIAKPLWEQFEDAGYVSARVDPMCQDWAAYYEAGHFPPSQTIAPRIAHEHIAFSCLPPHLPIGKSNSGNFAGPASIKARCFSGKHIGHHILDWSSLFISTYQGSTPYHLSAAFMEAHEGSGEVLSTLDDRLAEFFDPRRSVVDFNTTAIAVVSDHGALMGLNNAFFENGKVEAKNPFAAFVLPRWFVELEGKDEKLAKASGELVTPHDMYETNRGFIGGSRVDVGRIRGVNVLRDSIGERSCKEAGIDEEFCRCH